MIEVTNGFTGITVGTDALSGRMREPLSAAILPTGARVTLNFRRRAPLPERMLVSISYDFADNGCEREVQGVPKLTHTVMQGEEVFHHYRLSYWLAPHAVMKFLPPNVRQHTERREVAPQSLAKQESLVG